MGNSCQRCVGSGPVRPEPTYRHHAERQAIAQSYMESLRESAAIARHEDHRLQLITKTVHSFVHTIATHRIKIDRQWPADWWQAFKDRWFPAWLKRRYPVRYEQINIDRYVYGALCPHLQNDPLRDHLHFLSRHDSNAHA